MNLLFRPSTGKTNRIDYIQKIIISAPSKIYPRVKRLFDD